MQVRNTFPLAAGPEKQRMAKLVPFIGEIWTLDPRTGTPRPRVGVRWRRNKLRLIRLVWSDTHGHARTKEVTIEAFLSVLVNGYNINVATTTLDASVLRDRRRSAAAGPRLRRGLQRRGRRERRDDR